MRWKVERQTRRGERNELGERPATGVRIILRPDAPDEYCIVREGDTEELAMAAALAERARIDDKGEVDDDGKAAE